MRSELTRLGWGGVVGLAVTTACVGGAAEASHTARLAALEARVTELEGRVGSRAAPGDAGAEAPRTAGPTSGGALSLPEAAPPERTPEQVESACLELSAGACEHEARGKRLAALAAAGKHEWVPEASTPAESTAEGRACLARRKAECRAQGQARRRRVELVAWLDGQLTPERVDHAFTAALVERVRRVDKFGGAVNCTLQFCRVQAGVDQVNLSHVLDLSDGGGNLMLLSHGGFLYVNRPGYAFPH
ncbi:MAG: hypothetical protein KF718_29000 [Polyangiaceae bacterium]|nr:hypothetical protein [Polyangiaceae bacterium]